MSMRRGTVPSPLYVLPPVSFTRNAAITIIYSTHMSHLRNLLALIGALALVGGVTAWASRRIGYVEIVGHVLNADHTPA